MVDDHAEVVGDNWGWCRERCKEETVPCRGQADTAPEDNQAHEEDSEDHEVTTLSPDTHDDVSNLGREFRQQDNATCSDNDTCQDRCQGGSDLTCWCDDR